MKTKTFKNGTMICKSYLKQVGHGFEVCFTQGKRVIFLGTFAHSNEATHWYNAMNREIRKFGRKFKVGPKYPATWFTHFISHYLLKRYCSYQAKLMAKHTRLAARKEKWGEAKYRRLNRNWVSYEKRPVIKAA